LAGDPLYQFILDYYPKRRGDTKIYHSATPPEDPKKPREVLWTVIGLQAGQQVVITEKAGVQTNHLGKPKYTITTSETSGRARNHPPAGLADLWQYSIRLTPAGNDAVGSDLAKAIDPMVVIEHDP